MVINNEAMIGRGERLDFRKVVHPESQLVEMNVWLGEKGHFNKDYPNNSQGG